MNTRRLLSSVLALGLFLSSALASAAKPITCTTEQDESGGYKSVVIASKGNKTIITGHASGGEATFITGFGPFTAIRSSTGGDEVTYSWGEGNSNYVDIVTTEIKGKIYSTATTNYGLWANVTMDCK